ncbi:MAG: DUF3800 domain-containing protein [Candidatus Diapherotrites archaeon]|nr:DUF3800 domain-containing protein [Candidatus Diapherotrites archaeon]
MDNIIFIDKSGDLGCSSKSPPYLVISALIVENSEQLDRFIKNMRRNKFKKELKNAHEIKANNSKPYLIKHMLKKLNEIEHAQAFHIALKKNV